MSQKMNLYGKLYQEFVLDRLKNTDWKKGNSAPLVVELDTTSVCNLACPGCISEDLVTTGKRFSNDRLLQLGQEFIDAGVKAVILIGGGEPLAHRRAGDLIELLGSNDVHLGITTNGYYIDIYEEQIAEYSSWTRISVDAATAAVFDKLRPAKNRKSTFDKIIKNIESLSRSQSKRGKIGFSFLIRTKADGPDVVDNIHEIYDAAILAKQIGCDYFEIKPTYQFQNNVPHALMKHDAERMRVAKEEIAKLDELETEKFHIIHAINLEFSLHGVEEEQVKKYSVCPSAHLRTTVTPSGVYICPYWRGKERMCIGDVQNDSFRDVWRGKRRFHVMNELNASKDCYFHCLRHETNLACFKIKQEIDQKMNSPVADFDRFI